MTGKTFHDLRINDLQVHRQKKQANHAFTSTTGGPSSKEVFGERQRVLFIFSCPVHGTNSVNCFSNVLNLRQLKWVHWTSLPSPSNWKYYQVTLKLQYHCFCFSLTNTGFINGHFILKKNMSTHILWMYLLIYVTNMFVSLSFLKTDCYVFSKIML